MAPPRKGPKSFLVNGSQFGRSGAQWAPQQTQDALEVAAAYLQHRMALAIRMEGTSAENVAAALGENPGALRAKLHGARWAPLGDLIAWCLVFGDPLIEQFTVAGGVFPDTYAGWLGGWTPGTGTVPKFRPPVRRPEDIRWNDVADVLLLKLRSARVSQLLEIVVRDALRHQVLEALVETGVEGHLLDIDKDLSPEPGDILVGPRKPAAIRVYLELRSGIDHLGLIRDFAHELLGMFRQDFDLRIFLAVTRQRSMQRLRAAFPALTGEAPGVISVHEFLQTIGQAPGEVSLRCIANTADEQSDLAIAIIELQKLIPSHGGDDPRVGARP